MKLPAGFKDYRAHGRALWSSLLVAGLWQQSSGCSGSDRLPSLTVYEVTGKVVLADGKPLDRRLGLFRAQIGDLSVTPSARIADGRDVLAGDRRLGRRGANR